MEKFVAIIMAIFAAPLLIGGAYLLSLGGSPYYLIAGVIILTTAFLLFKKTLECLRVICTIYRSNHGLGALGIWVLLVGTSTSSWLPAYIWFAHATAMGIQQNAWA
ncbi:hypothetical protein [Psychrobacter sp. JCM 18901]|uniref:hypothetical protein n=1 Tax=Psychrobacter sp. JCM 18901 TaxID=1298609 RepID=UPI0004ADED05|nr:hypothetical protein [Psychrobacter sp. JCM 18901]